MQRRGPDPTRYRWTSRRGEPVSGVTLSGDWLRVCPDCGRAKSIHEYGLRNVEGVVYDQPKCTPCRHKTRES